MTLLVDAAPLVAAADRRDPAGEAVRRLLREAGEPLVVPAPVTAEADYLLRRRLSASSARGFLEDIGTGRFIVESLDATEYALVAALDRQYASLDPGLADLSLVVLARRLATNRIVTFDERDFRAVRPLQGGAFTLLPADAAQR